MKRCQVRQRYRMVELQRWHDRRGLKFHLQFDRRYLRRAFTAVWERSAQSRPIPQRSRHPLSNRGCPAIGGALRRGGNHSGG